MRRNRGAEQQRRAIAAQYRDMSRTTQIEINFSAPSGVCCCGGGSGGGGCDLPTTLYFKTELWSDVGGSGEKKCCEKTFPIYNTGTGTEENPIWLAQVPWTDNLCDYVCYALFQCYASGDYRLFVGSACMGTGSWDGNYESDTGLDWGQPWGTRPLDLELPDWFSVSTGLGAQYGTYQPSCPFPLIAKMFVSETAFT